MKLSEHLTLKEATYSATAIKHALNNNPLPAQVKVLEQIAKVIFEPCREYVGGPLRVTSGFRGEELNEKIGGAISSDHTINDHKTAALDLDCDVYGFGNNAMLFHYIRKNLPFKQLIWEFGDEYKPNWVHVSYSTNELLNKGEVLIAKKKGKRTVYELYKD